MEFTKEIITPELARQYLKNSIVNRNPSHQRISSYANDMKNGRWQLNGESIKFDTTGKLIDGQHRLLAIIEANIPIMTHVLRGVDCDVSIFDRGRNRSSTDALVIEGMPKEIANSTNVAVAKLHARVQNHLGKISISDSYIRDFLQEHADSLLKLRAVTSKGHDRNAVNTGRAIFILPMLYALEAGETLENIEAFANVVRSGFYNNESEKSAVVLRNDILTKKIQVQGGESDRVHAVVCIENALFDFCAGRPRVRTYATSKNRVYSAIATNYYGR